MLDGHVEAAPPGSQGFDCNTKLTAKSAAGLRQAGFRFAVRYLTRGSDAPPSDLSRDEADLILDAGLALMAVQHVAKENWTPTETLGRQSGVNAAKHAQQIELPAGVNVWLDLEGVKAGVGAQAVIDYCNAWFESVGSAGYTTGIYVGASCRLNGDDLYWRLRTRHYWKSGSKVPEIPHRGYQMIQRILKKDVVATVAIDRNVTRTDDFGDAVQWLTRS